MKQLILRQKQVIFFIIAGGLSAIVEIGSFKILSVYLPRLFSSEYNLYGIKYPFSNILSTSCGIITNYFLSIWFVFERGKHSKKKEFLYFISVSVVSTFISLILFQILYHFVFRNIIDLKFYVLSPEMMSKITAILLVSMLNYSIKKKIIFNG
jgi:putative flippase GtrA